MFLSPAREYRRSFVEPTVRHDEDELPIDDTTDDDTDDDKGPITKGQGSMLQTWGPPLALAAVVLGAVWWLRRK